jgi:hypothetical protein
MNMNPFFFSRKEVKPVISNAKNGRAHKESIKRSHYIVNKTFYTRSKIPQFNT